MAIGGAAAGAKASSLVPQPVLLARIAALLLVIAGVVIARQLGSRRGQPEAHPNIHFDNPIVAFKPSFGCDCRRGLPGVCACQSVPPAEPRPRRPRTARAGARRARDVRDTASG